MQSQTDLESKKKLSDEELIKFVDEEQDLSTSEFKIDFNRSPNSETIKINSQILNSGLNNLITEIARECAAILKLPSNYVITVKQVQESVLGSRALYTPTEEGADLSLSDSLVYGALQSRDGFLSLVRDIAHEMYHSRQDFLFSSFYNSRMSKYIRIEEDQLNNKHQVLEIGARAFEETLVDFFTGQNNKRFPSNKLSDNLDRFPLSRNAYYELKALDNPTTRIRNNPDEYEAYKLRLKHIYESPKS